MFLNLKRKELAVVSTQKSLVDEYVSLVKDKLQELGIQAKVTGVVSSGIRSKFYDVVLFVGGVEGGKYRSHSAISQQMRLKTDPKMPVVILSKLTPPEKRLKRSVKGVVELDDINLLGKSMQQALGLPQE